MVDTPTELVLGRGEVWFNQFLPGTRQGLGERYIGNTTTVQIGRRTERLERYASFDGQRVEVEGANISERHTVTFITDNIDIENVGAWYGGGSEPVAYAGVNLITETVQAAPGRTIQLGTTVHPSGIRAVESVVVRRSGVVVPAVGNYSIDKRNGRVAILPTTTAIETGDVLDISFEWRTHLLDRAVSSPVEVVGSLRFLAFNAVGGDKSYFFPYVRLSARGQVDLKGDEFQQIPFEATAMRLTPMVQQVYIEEIVSILYTDDELAIINLSGISLDDFPFWENEIDILTNITIPSHDYAS